jgi:hypothetical protein
MQPCSIKDENAPHETNLIFILFMHILYSVKYASVFVHELNKYVKFYGRQQKILEYEKMSGMIY